MIGHTLGRYRILEEIGAGGMGVVYRAHDERLDRDVAIKVLSSSQLADAGSRKRLRKEAVALSKLNHPGIATAHDFGSQRGMDYLVMELIPGVSLKETLGEGPLPEDEVLRLGVEMAAALAAAHDKHIVHRDLKPANIRITPDGRLKILDFGLARLRPAGSEMDFTTGTVAGGDLVTGTLPYMAPEHLRGGDVDTRSDVHAAGAVLYEMATGTRAFPESGAQLIDAILNRPPAPPHRIRPDLSPALEAIILHSLEKDPRRRPQSARELLAALQAVGDPTQQAALPARTVRPRQRWLVTAALSAGTALIVAGVLSLPGDRKEPLPAAGAIQSVAVLPLANLSRDTDQEYFADGMTEALIAELARSGRVRVISRTSAMHYKGSRKRLPEVARELNVDAVVEGTVLRSGPRVRITAQLVHAPSDRNMWADTYERDLSDVLSLQSEVARAIAQEVAGNIEGGDKAPRLTIVRRVDPQVYQLYLKGRFSLNQGRETELRQAVRHFEQALARDPTYAAAWSGLADTYLRLDDFDAMAEAESRGKAQAAARKALELDEALAEAHVSLGHLAIHEWRWPTAEAEFRRATELEPGYTLGHQFFSAYLGAMGRTAEALDHARQARALDPLSPDTGVTLAWQLYLARQLDESIALGRSLVATEPNAPRVRWRLGCAYLAKGAVREGAAELERFATLTSPPRRALAVRAVAAARSGDRKQAESLLGQLRTRPDDGYHPAIEMALVQAALGRTDEAFRSLETAYQERLEWLSFLKADPLFDPLRGDARFAALVKKIGLPQ
jgi:eukaryotic-like serine/threonine-protein kinase